MTSGPPYPGSVLTSHPTSDISWLSLETCSNFITSGSPLPSLVLISSGEARTVGASGRYASCWNSFLFIVGFVHEWPAVCDSGDEGRDAGAV